MVNLLQKILEAVVFNFYIFLDSCCLVDDSIHNGSLNELLSYLNNGECHNHLCYACRVYSSIELHTCDNPTHFDNKEHFVGHNQLPDLNRQFLSLRTLSLKWGYNVGANLSWKDWFSSHKNYKQYHNVKRTEGRIWTLMFGCKGLNVKMGGKLPQKMMFMAQCIKEKIHMLRLKLKVWPFS